jgi:hypothetical protein
VSIGVGGPGVRLGVGVALVDGGREPVVLGVGVADAGAVAVTVALRLAVGVAGGGPVRVTLAVAVRVAVPLAVLVATPVAVAVAARVPVRVGVPLAVALGVGDGTASASGQKPPESTKLPPLTVPASGWPIVPPRRKAPPVLKVAPPPSIVLREIANPSTAWAGGALRTRSRPRLPSSAHRVARGRSMLDIPMTAPPPTAA